MIQYQLVDGVMRRVRKQYVSVMARFTDAGDIVPMAVCWPDGRTFPIDEVLEQPEGMGIDMHGIRQARYTIRMGGHESRLYLEHIAENERISRPESLRWWGYAIDRKRPKPGARTA
jgi:hypothetical protein